MPLPGERAFTRPGDGSAQNHSNEVGLRAGGAEGSIGHRAGPAEATGTIAERVKVLAVDYGRARTGVAISDSTGTVARPLELVENAGSAHGLARIAALARREDAERVVVGMPLTLRGERGEQARETERFVEELRQALPLPVDTFDERFTTRIAARTASSSSDEDAVAAAHLLSDYLTWTSNRT